MHGLRKLSFGSSAVQNPWLNPTVRAFVRRALEEDIGTGDITSETLIDPKCRVSAGIIARRNYVIAGVEIVRLVCHLVDRQIVCRILAPDGQKVKAGESIVVLTGRARSIMAVERTALNFLQRLTGIASLTAQYVAAARPYRVKILDTRKTTPNMRLLEKYAVRCGGGHNHRMGLYDMILIKDNHRFLWQKNNSFSSTTLGLRPLKTLRPCSPRPELGTKAGQAVAGLAEAGPGSTTPATTWKFPHAKIPCTLADAVNEARRKNPKVPIEVEVESIAQFKDALSAAPEWIMLDNMSIPLMKKCAALCYGRSGLEASGGITLENINAIAATGVNAISIGALTHSAPAADLSLEVTR